MNKKIISDHLILTNITTLIDKNMIKDNYMLKVNPIPSLSKRYKTLFLMRKYFI